MQKICHCKTENNNIVFMYTVQVVIYQSIKNNNQTKRLNQFLFSLLCSHHLNSTVIVHCETHCRLSSNSLIQLMRTIPYYYEQYHAWLKSKDKIQNTQIVWKLTTQLCPEQVYHVIVIFCHLVVSLQNNLSSTYSNDIPVTISLTFKVYTPEFVLL